MSEKNLTEEQKKKKSLFSDPDLCHTAPHQRDWAQHEVKAEGVKTMKEAGQVSEVKLSTGKGQEKYLP